MTDNVVELRPPAPQPPPSSPEANVHRLTALGMKAMADTLCALAVQQRALADAMDKFADVIEAQQRN